MFAMIANKTSYVHHPWAIGGRARLGELTRNGGNSHVLGFGELPGPPKSRQSWRGLGRDWGKLHGPVIPILGRNA